MNEEHVRIVREGRFASWRAANLDVLMDLSGASLKMADLNGADLVGANLIGADLSGAYLGGAYLNNANLNGANLSGAYLVGANLNYADLSEANLRGANMKSETIERGMTKVWLIGTDLEKADLRDVSLHEAILVGANLTNANLSNADLSWSLLVRAEMSGADLTGANLLAANLCLAKLQRATMIGVDLRRASLIGADLSESTLTGAKLFGTARDDWDIEGVICDHVFWDKDGASRSPAERDLVSGEFEQLYAQLPTIEYVFENGLTPLDPVVMDLIVQSINERNPEFELQIDSLNTRGIYPTIKFNVKFEEQKTDAIEAITQAYDLRFENEGLKGEIRGLLAGMDHMARQPLITDSVVALPGGRINIQEYIGHLQEIQQAIEEMPPETLSEGIKHEAMDTVAEGIKDIAKVGVKEVAKRVTERITHLGIEAVTKTRGFQALADLVD